MREDSVQESSLVMSDSPPNPSIDGHSKESGWQPIESAPKVPDIRILVCDARENLYWPQIVVWVDWGGPGRWWDQENAAVALDAYSHWQPLPSPPES